MFKTSPLLRMKSSEEIFPEGFSLHYAQISSVRCSAMKSIQAVSSLNPHVWTRPHTGNGENFRLHFFLHKIKHLTLKGSISVTIIQNRSLGARWALTSGPLDPPDSKPTESRTHRTPDPLGFCPHSFQRISPNWQQVFSRLSHLCRLVEPAASQLTSPWC